MKLSRIIIPWIVVWLSAAAGLTACRQATVDPTPTLAPTAARPPALPAVATTLPPPPTDTAASPTTLPTPTPCRYAVLPALAAAWNPAELGCPITSGVAIIATAYAPFEGGQMLWRGDSDTIYVLFNDGRWASYPNEWREGDPEFSCGEESSPPSPVRGFGRVWCENEAVRLSLGAATAAEIGDGASAAQEFVNGTILMSPFGSLFVFVGEDGVWRRVDD